MDGHPHLLDVGELLEDTQAADHEHLGAALDVAAGGVGAGLPEGGEDVRQAHAEGGHPSRVRLHVDLAQEPSVRDHVGHSGDLQETRPHHPVLQRPQGHGIGARPRHGIAVDLADGSGHGPEAGLHA